MHLAAACTRAASVLIQAPLPMPCTRILGSFEGIPSVPGFCLAASQPKSLQIPDQCPQAMHASFGRFHLAMEREGDNLHCFDGSYSKLVILQIASYTNEALYSFMNRLSLNNEEIYRKTVQKGLCMD